MKIPSICPYCAGKVILTEATDIFEHGDGMIYLCTNCNAFVSCHKGSTRPMGKLANAALRMKRRETHQIFDNWWKSQGVSRTQGYKWMAEQMKLPAHLAHIAQFDMEACEQVILLCRENQPKYEGVA